jgi:hypothetical protein
MSAEKVEAPPAEGPEVALMAALGGVEMEQQNSALAVATTAQATWKSVVLGRLEPVLEAASQSGASELGRTGLIQTDQGEAKAAAAELYLVDLVAGGQVWGMHWAAAASPVAGAYSRWPRSAAAR